MEEICYAETLLNVAQDKWEKRASQEDVGNLLANSQGSICKYAITQYVK